MDRGGEALGRRKGHMNSIRDRLMPARSVRSRKTSIDGRRQSGNWMWWRELSEDSTARATHMLLYMNDRTFADGGATAHVVRDAMSSGVRMVIVHEKEVNRGAVAFGAFFDGRCVTTM